MNLSQKKKLYLKARKVYDNDPDGAQLMTDPEFDDLEREIRAAEPKWEELDKTGSAVNKKTECVLPRFMPSLHKKYPDKIEAALTKRAQLIIVPDKIDGSALLVQYVPDSKGRGVPKGAWTRGNGTVGGDISFLIPHLNLPVLPKLKAPVFLRCEAAMTARKFAARHSDKSSARAVVNGALNRMTKSKALADTDIIVLGVYGMKLADGLVWAASVGLTVVNYALVLKADFDISAHLKQRRAKSAYAIDGVVCANADQLFDYADAEKPKHSFAYKENVDLSQALSSEVLSIIWQTSAKRVLVPKIRIKPLSIDGSTVQHATAHNAQWMLDKGLGIGAIVQVVKSGDVIPKIVNVIKKTKPSLPTVAYSQQGVHFVADNESKESECRAILKFFTTMGIEFIALRTIEDLYDIGFKSPLHYAKIWHEDKWLAKTTKLLGAITARKIKAEFDRVLGAGVHVDTLMIASNCFAAGLGERKLSMVRESMGLNFWARLYAEWDTYNDSTRTKLGLRLVAKTEGWSQKTVALVFNSMPEFCAYAKKFRACANFVKRATVTKATGSLNGVLFSFTGYRDAAQEQALLDKGGTIVPFSSKTQVLFYRDKGKSSSKVDTAKARGTEVAVYEIYMKGKK